MQIPDTYVPSTELLEIKSGGNFIDNIFKENSDSLSNKKVTIICPSAELTRVSIQGWSFERSQLSALA